MATAINLFRISLISALTTGDFESKEQKLQKHVDFMLSILPPETKFVSATWQPTTDLSATCAIEFEHAIFDELPGFCDAVTQIKDHYVRVAWKENEKLKQGTIFTGIEYLTAKGENRFPFKPC